MAPRRTETSSDSNRGKLTGGSAASSVSRRDQLPTVGTPHPFLHGRHGFISPKGPVVKNE
jgi:hypothetical protein